jgi:LuxR family maltose regulon positive regulatory protein
MRKARQETTLLRWLRGLPDELFDVRPVLSVGYAGTLLSVGEVAGVERRLRAAERWLETPAGSAGAAGGPPSGMVVVDETEFGRLPGAIALFRVGHARMTGDVPRTIELARRALELVPEDDHIGRGGIAALLALSYWTNGDLDAAYRSYAEAMASLERAGHLADVVGGSVVLGDLLIAQGRLDDAMAAYEGALRLAASQGGPPLRGAADMHVGMSGLFRERNDVAAASHELDLSRELGDENGFPQNPYRSRVAAARIRQAVGDLGGAVALLDEAEHVYFGDFSPDVRPVAAVRARVWIAQGRLPDASRWGGEQGLTATGDLTYLHEFEYATLARLLLAQGTQDAGDGRIGEAIELSERLVAAAEDRGRTGSQIDALVVLALARHARDDAPGALASLARAVELAAPERYVRVFLDEGQPMTALLKVATKQRNAPPYLRTLLAAAVTTEADGPVKQPLIEPLSERELDVLRLLRSDLGGPDIARELAVSLATVRTHTQSVYAKLGVNSRRAAVERAADLGLLSR